MVVFLITIVIAVGAMGLIFGYLTLPSFPDALMTVWQTMIGAIRNGLGIIYNFVDKELVVGIVAISVTIWVSYRLYLLILWIMKKFPFDIN